MYLEIIVQFPNVTLKRMHGFLRNYVHIFLKIHKTVEEKCSNAKHY